MALGVVETLPAVFFDQVAKVILGKVFDVAWIHRERLGEVFLNGGASSVLEAKVRPGLPDDVFLQAKLHALHHRIPGLPYRGRPRGYCGLYTVNEQDVHPVVGETELAGFYLANGFSGHGFKLAPAIGSLLARMITGTSAEFDTGIRTDFFSIGRRPFDLQSKSVLA